VVVSHYGAIPGDLQLPGLTGVSTQTAAMNADATVHTARRYAVSLSNVAPAQPIII